jgi:predicted TIM-barrel fold metal-dependent hydrolase
MIIDHHNHIWIGESTGEGFLEESMTIETILKEMDVAGIDMAGVCTLAQDVNNEYVIQAQKQHPDRLFGYAFINPRGKNAVSDLKHLLDAGLQGLKLHPRLHAFSLSNLTMVGPLMELCNEFQVPMFAHGSSNEEFNRPNHFVEVAKAFPDVPVIYGHMGVFNYVDEAIQAAKQIPNLYLDTSTAPSLEVQLALKSLGPDKILMSTDWPTNDFKLEKYKIELITKNDPEARRKIMGDNYARIMKRMY